MARDFSYCNENINSSAAEPDASAIPVSYDTAQIAQMINA